MTLCNCKCSCSIGAVVISLIIGIITAFLQITAVITVTPAFLWVAFGIGVGFLGILTVMTGSCCAARSCSCGDLNTLLFAILGTILFSVILLAVGIVATSVVSAILVGILLFFLALIFTSVACYVRCAANCDD